MSRVTTIALILVLYFAASPSTALSYFRTGNESSRTSLKVQKDPNNVDARIIVTNVPLILHASPSDDLQKPLYGPWGTAHELHDKLIKRLKQSVDEQPLYDEDGIAFTNADRNFYKAFIDKVDGAMNSTDAWGGKSEKEPVDFKFLSAKISELLNNYLKNYCRITTPVFGPRDFIPAETDYYSDRVVEAVVVEGQRTETGVGTRHRWLTMWEYIHRTYDRVAARMLPLMSASKCKG